MSEQLAIRDIDVQLKPIKTKTRRETPYASLHEPLLELSLGLAADATVEEVTAAQQAKLESNSPCLHDRAEHRPDRVATGIVVVPVVENGQVRAQTQVRLLR